MKDIDDPLKSSLHETAHLVILRNITTSMTYQTDMLNIFLVLTSEKRVRGNKQSKVVYSCIVEYHITDKLLMLSNQLFSSFPLIVFSCFCKRA